MFSPLNIRPAVAKDAEQLAKLAAQTFTDAFACDNTVEDIRAYVRDAFNTTRIQSELQDPANGFLLAFLEGASDPIGYAKLRSGTTEQSVTGPRPIELERLYVSQSVIGQGIGARLMEASLEVACDGEYQTIWLGVWEQNERAIAFYQKWQFEAVGDHIFQLGTDSQRDLIMARPVIWK